MSASSPSAEDFSTSNSVTATQYVYGPFGELFRATGPMAKANPFRFSTKYQDNETDLIYYGYRYYDPSTGRWLNCDPLGELGFETLRHGRANLLGDGPNLYAFVQNNPVDRTDSLGLAISSIDGAMEACMRLPTPAMQQECISDLLDTLGVSKECCVLAAAVQVATDILAIIRECRGNVLR